jgi:hypothetical protein
MQISIVAADSVTTASPAHQLTNGFPAASMLGTCTTNGCTSIIFGRGTCVTHDPRAWQPPDASLESVEQATSHDHLNG